MPATYPYLHTVHTCSVLEDTVYQGSPTNFPQTEKAAWMSSEMFQPNKKKVQLP